MTRQPVPATLHPTLTRRAELWAPTPSVPALSFWFLAVGWCSQPFSFRGALGCGLRAGDRGAVGQCSLAPGARAGCGRFGFWGFRWSPCQPEATVSERETTG